jgi:transposase InsO family protein
MAARSSRGSRHWICRRQGLDAVSQLRYRKIRKDWRERGLTAPRLRRLLLKQAQWDENALARLLGIETAEVRCVLRQAGYAQSPDELWRPGEGPDAVARRAKLDAIVEDAENDTP